MTDRMDADAFSTRYDLADWRILVRRIETTYRLANYAAAAAFVVEVGDAAESANHHPDIDLRYPGRVHISLTTHAAGGLTALDADLASTISALADRAGAVSEPELANVFELAVDALDIEAVRPFWSAVLGYVDGPTADGEQINDIRDPIRVGPSIWFQQMDTPRDQRNRLHVDINVSPDAAGQRVADALAAGGRLVTDQYAPSWWVLADVEGNEACVCTWRDALTVDSPTETDER